MDSKKIVLRETGIVALGEAVGTAVMIGVFVLLDKFDLTVLFGGLMGWLITAANFFFLAVSASLASDRAVEQDVEGAKKLVKASQTYRFLGVAVALVLCAVSKKCNLIALVVPLLLFRPVLMLSEFFRKKG